MTRALISKKTRQEFREYFVGTTLRHIEMAFDAADVPFDGEYAPQMSGARRSLVEQYYRAVDWTNWRDVRKVLEVYENVLIELEAGAAGDGQWAQQSRKQLDALTKWLAKDGFIFQAGKLQPVDRTLQLSDVAEVAVRFGAPELHRQLERMRAAVEDDPGLAIGTAKELLETTCKTILDERGVPVDSAWDINRLVKETRAVLDLLPANVSDAAKGAEVARRLLSNLGAVAQGLAELRNHTELAMEGTAVVVVLGHDTPDLRSALQRP